MPHKFRTAFAILIGCLWSLQAIAQVKYVPNYYRFPIEGKQHYLAGTMGELRSGHFHAGIDIKTGGVTGKPVHAAADGYVSRIKVSKYGYGWALYIAHPNGSTTVYGHLSKYNEAIAAAVLKAQYEQKSYSVELFPAKDEFPVKQGEIVAYSGNSGGSGGPHLHFEIRDKNQIPVNPLTFHFDQIKDNVAPTATRIALRPMDIDSRVNKEFQWKDWPLKYNLGTYYIDAPVNAYGRIGIEVLAFDRLNGANNKNGVCSFSMSINDSLIYHHNIDRVSFAESRQIMVYTNYEIAKKRRQKFAKLYVDQGNELKFQQQEFGDGTFWVEPDSTYHVVITMGDAYENHRKIAFDIKGKVLTDNKIDKTVKPKQPYGFKVNGNNLLYWEKKSEEDSLNKAVIHMAYAKAIESPDYSKNDVNYYLWDLYSGIPDSISFHDRNVHLPFEIEVPAGAKFNYFHDRFDLKFKSNTLFQDLYLHTSYEKHGKQEIFTIGENTIPLKSSYTVTLKADGEYDHEKTAVFTKSGKYYGYVGGKWSEGNKITFSTRSFGHFTIKKDTIPPKINPIQLKNNKLKFRISDNLSGIKSFNAYVNGQWILLHYDYKTRLLVSERLDKTKPLKGELKVEIEDFLGNVGIYKTTLR